MWTLFGWLCRLQCTTCLALNLDWVFAWKLLGASFIVEQQSIGAEGFVGYTIFALNVCITLASDGIATIWLFTLTTEICRFTCANCEKKKVERIYIYLFRERLSWIQIIFSVSALTNIYFESHREASQIILLNMWRWQHNVFTLKTNKWYKFVVYLRRWASLILKIEYNFHSFFVSILHITEPNDITSTNSLHFWLEACIMNLSRHMKHEPWTAIASLDPNINIPNAPVELTLLGENCNQHYHRHWHCQSIHSEENLSQTLNELLLSLCLPYTSTAKRKLNEICVDQHPFMASKQW